jgi:diguanylate cyclase (GGDEF)-like protein
MWRSGAVVLALAAAVSVLEAVAVGPSERALTLVSGLFPAVGSVVAWFGGPRLSPLASLRAGRVFLGLGVGSAALSMHNWDGTMVGAAMAFHFVLAAIFAAVFFDRRDVLELLALVVVLQLAVLAGDGHVTAQDGLTFVLTQLAVAGSGLVLSSAVAAMDALSYRDPLTGAGTRRAWDVALAGLATAEARRRTPVSVLLVDVDHFKAINDRDGHDGGDAVLRSAVAVWRDVTRASDSLARLGGDEFGLLMPGCGHDAARRVATQLLADLRDLVGCTCSIGVATVLPGTDLAALLPTADAQLYEAKRAGRACVRGAVVDGAPASAGTVARRLSSRPA